MLLAGRQVKSSVMRFRVFKRSKVMSSVTRVFFQPCLAILAVCVLFPLEGFSMRLVYSSIQSDAARKFDDRANARKKLSH